MKTTLLREDSGARWRISWRCAAAALLLLAAAMGQAHAQTGTAAGTQVTNQASVTYNTGVDQRTAQSNTTSFYVAHKVVFNWTPNSSPNRSATTVDNVARYYAFTVTNSGNRADNFNLTTSNVSGVPSGTWSVQIVQTGNDNAVTSTGSLAPGATFSGRLKVTIPANQTDGTVKTLTLTATSTATNDAPNNIVVANPGATSAFSVQVTVAKPVIAFTATQNPTTPTNAQSIPGQNITYTMTLQNTGTAAIATDPTVTFALDPNFRFVSATGSGSNAGADGNGNGGTVSWTIDHTLLGAGGSSFTRQVVVQIQQVTNNGTGVAAGTAMTAMTTASGTQTKVQYSDGDNTINQDNANSFTFNVGTASGAQLTQVTANQGGNPGDTVEYQYSVKNTGNHSDSYNLTQVRNAGDLDVTHLFSTTSKGTAITSVSVGQGVTTTLYVRTVIPITATDGQTIVRTIGAATSTATPTAPTGGSTGSNDDVTTTVTAAQVSVVLSGGSADVISQPSGYAGVTGVIPGTVVRYTVTVTNTGTGTAHTISATNVSAHLTTNTLVPNTVDVDADGDGTFELTGLGDGYSGGGVGVTINGATGFVAVTFTQIPSGAYRKYRYNIAVQ
ncbi:MAG TPA: hypothetical protein VHI13_06905 [Candidatus Kapabacteria bacterium]|nr:hypothetical protein [Candidatus Kapabacteria bacterium]